MDFMEEAGQTMMRAPPGFDANKAENLDEIEKQFAVKAVQQLEVYWSLLRAVRGSTLKLTKMDDAIYAHFIAEFPDYDVSKPLDENEMKSPKGKERWRNFINHYEKLIPDYAFGTILRISPHEEYGQYSTIFAVRTQFYAIEIARNKNKLNDWVYEEAQKQQSSA